ncbi:MAG TPA: hypothetical protein IGR15_04510 [Synechococcus sp. M44_DOE_062]|nr:hypothetical protein [Synechococcus sp. M44_DOE_062]
MVGSHSICFDWAADFYDATRSFPLGVEEIFQAAIARLRAWFGETYPDPSAILLGESRFQMLLARW